MAEYFVLIKVGRRNKEVLIEESLGEGLNNMGGNKSHSIIRSFIHNYLIKYIKAGTLLG